MKTVGCLLGEYIRWLAMVVCSVAILLCASGLVRRDDAIKIHLMNYPEGNIQTMELEEYITGVLKAEVPASFSRETLKAQAVASRTYACKAMISGKHDGFDICTDSSCCQAFQSESQQETGLSAFRTDKIRNAVRETKGQVIIFQDQLIEAAFFSSSGGKTENAADVWGWDYPYLKSITSSGEESAPHYTEEFRIPKEKMREIFEIPKQDDITIDHICYTDGGGIRSLNLSGNEIPGTRFRTLLKLPSTKLQIEEEVDSFRVTSSGFGHRVGMSQYGAQAMALKGEDYRSILTYYYPGTAIQSIKPALFS